MWLFIWVVGYLFTFGFVIAYTARDENSTVTMVGWLWYIFLSLLLWPVFLGIGIFLVVTEREDG